MKPLLPRPTYGNVMATIAVFVALGGVSYAASEGTGPASRTWDGSTYRVSKTIDRNSPFEGPGILTVEDVLCRQGDRALGGGYVGLDPSIGTISSSFPIKTAGNDKSLQRQGWSVSYVNTKASIPSGVTVTVRCANFK
jgi:hypothetical protein